MERERLIYFHILVNPGKYSNNNNNNDSDGEGNSVVKVNDKAQALILLPIWKMSSSFSFSA